MSTHNAKKLNTFLAKKKKEITPLLILTHDFPDPDALAAAYALQFLAEKAFKIQSRIVYKGIVGRVENQNMVRYLNIPAKQLKPWEIQRSKNIALVDTQPDFENNPFPNGRKATIIIDQHPPLDAKKRAADLTIVDTKCGATSVIVAQSILSLKMKVPEKLATALAYGISSDTMNLFRAARPDIIATYLKILSYANMRDLAHIQIPQYDKNYFYMLQKGIRTAGYAQGLVLCHLGNVKSPDVVSQMADFLLSYRHTLWALVTGRFKSKMHVSLRTKKKTIPAARLLRSCFANPEDAGGHGTIAGGALRIKPLNKRKFKIEENRLSNNLIKQLRLKPTVFSRIYQ